MKEYKDQEILEGILNHDRRIINFIYEHHFPMIENMILYSGGSETIAKDIFQDGMMIVYDKVKRRNLQLRCKFSTYMYSICRKLWIQEIKYGKRLSSGVIKIEDMNLAEEPEPEYRKMIFKIFDKHFNDLSSDCKKLLELHFKRFTINEIRELMGFADSHYVMDKKYRCKKSLVKRIMNDPLFKELNNGLKYTGRKIS